MYHPADDDNTSKDMDHTTTTTQVLYYTHSDMQQFIKQAQVMAHRARKSVQQKAEQAPLVKIKYHCRGLEDLLTIQAGMLARQRRRNTVVAVLEEVKRQQQEQEALRQQQESSLLQQQQQGHGVTTIYDMDAIRSKSRATTKTSLQLALAYAKQDHLDALMEHEPSESKTAASSGNDGMTPAFRRASKVFAEQWHKNTRVDRRLSSSLTSNNVAATAAAAFAAAEDADHEPEQ